MLFVSFMVSKFPSWQQKALVGLARRARQRVTSSAKIENPPALPLVAASPRRAFVVKLPSLRGRLHSF
jgi:hypothetical protein